MKILHIITRLIQGGAQHDTVMTCAEQVRAGHEVWLVHGPIYGPEGSLQREALGCGATVVEMEPLRRPILPWNDVRCYFALRRLIDRFRPQIVHTHSSKAGIVGRAAAWGCLVPAVIHTIHGLPFHDRQTKLLNHLYVRSERWAAARCHKLIGITHAMCSAFAAHGIGRAEQFTMVPSGVDLERFEPAPDARERTRCKLRIADDAPVIGIVARLDPLKGQEDMLAILPKLCQSHPDVHVVFVGDGWYRHCLERIVHRQKVINRVTFVGLIPPNCVPDALAAMDVVALPSYQEGQGLALIEALLCRCAIVAYDAGGIGEVCIDGQTGRLVPVGNHEALLEAIRWMLDHPSQRQRLTDQGREFVRRRFDRPTMVRCLEQVYRQVLGQALAR